jgi:integrase
LPTRPVQIVLVVDTSRSPPHRLGGVALRLVPGRREGRRTAARGSYVDIEKFRHREWAPAIRAVGLEHRRIYDTRHTFATWSIEQGVHLWHLATVMGTSVTQLEDTYARWLKRTDDQLRAAFDFYDEAAVSRRG